MTTRIAARGASAEPAVLPVRRRSEEGPQMTMSTRRFAGDALRRTTEKGRR